MLNFYNHVPIQKFYGTPNNSNRLQSRHRFSRLPTYRFAIGKKPQLHQEIPGHIIIVAAVIVAAIATFLTWLPIRATPSASNNTCRYLLRRLWLSRALAQTRKYCGNVSCKLRKDRGLGIILVPSHVTRQILLMTRNFEIEFLVWLPHNLTDSNRKLKMCALSMI